MSDPDSLPFGFPSGHGNMPTTAFDGYAFSESDILLLAHAVSRLRIVEKLAAVITDRRDPTRFLHRS